MAPQYRIQSAIITVLLLVSSLACQEGSPKQVYVVRRIDRGLFVDARWDKPQWNDIQPLTLTHSMGPSPGYTPVTQAKVAYDDSALYVIFRVQDQYVRAVADSFQGRVYEDSCVEFFFTPGENTAEGYFNLETNCMGTQLFAYQREPWTDVHNVSAADHDRMAVASSLPGVVNPEIKTPLIWTVAYALPWSVLSRYTKMTRPQKGTRWRANFYKCANASSHPHFFTWKPVQSARPNFHLPQYFGWLVFR